MVPRINLKEKGIKRIFLVECYNILHRRLKKYYHEGSFLLNFQAFKYKCLKCQVNRSVKDKKTSGQIENLVLNSRRKNNNISLDLVLDESTVNSFMCWTEKYQPIKARHIIGDKSKNKELFNWLCLWKEKHESIVKKLTAKTNKM